MRTQVTIIGYGNMGQAIARALRRHRGVEVFTVGRDTKEALQRRYVSKSKIVVLAVKPKDAAEALARQKGRFAAKTILISILAGVPLRKLAQMSGHKKIIRMMPNLGLAFGEGIAVWKSAGLTAAEAAQAKKFTSLFTENFEVKDEDTINKITAISGSGPAYFLLLAKSLMAAGASFGLTAEMSRKLVEKTFLAAAALGKESDYGEAIQKIASKKGTTEAALRVFKDKNFEKIVRQAARAAYERAKELSK